MPSIETSENPDVKPVLADAAAHADDSSLRYDYSLDSFDETSHYGRLLCRVGHNKRVLELGCSTGYLTSAMTDHFGCTVTGVEVDADAAQAARARGHEVLVLDLDKVDLGEIFAGRTFDVVLCADVLEHLRQPEATLRQLNDLLSPDGYVITSIPHVGHGDIRLSLLNGRLPYRPMGLLDHTHMKFFTRALLEELFESANFCLESVERNRWQLTRTEVQGRMPPSLPALRDFIAFDPESETYQFIVKARPYKDGEKSLNSATLPRVDILVIDQGAEIADDLYQRYLSAINYPAHLLKYWFVSTGGGLQLVDKPATEAKAYSDSDFRTFRFLSVEGRDDQMTVPDEISSPGSRSRAVDINVASTIAQVARGSDADYIFVLLANALPGTNCLQKLAVRAEASKEGLKPLFAARPEIRPADQPAPANSAGHIAWHDFSAMLLPRDFLIELKSLDPNLWTVKGQAIDMCFRAWACGRPVIECAEANYFSNGPLGCPGDYDDTVADGLRLRRRWGSLRNLLAFARYSARRYGSRHPLTWIKTANHVVAAMAIETPLRHALSSQAQSLVAFTGPGASRVGLGQ